MELINCIVPGCPKTCEGYKWAKIRAANAGWFFSKSGKAVCPTHALRGKAK